MTWQEILPNQTFIFVDSIEEADTIIYWHDKYSPKIGLTTNIFIKNKLTDSKIDFYIKDYRQHPHSPQVIYKTALHEIGHLLGLMGHSKNINDIMFPSITKTESLSERDRNTLLELYKKSPDITNPDSSTLSEYNKAHKNSALIKIFQSF